MQYGAKNVITLDEEEEEEGNPDVTTFNVLNSDIELSSRNMSSRNMSSRDISSREMVPPRSRNTQHGLSSQEPPKGVFISARTRTSYYENLDYNQSTPRRREREIQHTQMPDQAHE